MTDIFALDSYDYDLPDGLIATHPASPRDAARLLVWDGGGGRERIFADLDAELAAGDVLVVNDSRVIPARLRGVRPRRPGAADDVAVEVLLHKPLADTAHWAVFARPAKRLRAGEALHFAGGVTAEITGRLDEQVTLRFDLAPEAVFAFLDAHGEVPLPPYIDRAADASDTAEYQTVYAGTAHGSVAAPTAGLHFTDALLDRLRAKGVTVCRVTLHVGAGTFLPVTAGDIRTHQMHSEWGAIDAATADAINAAKDRGGRIVAVGTTATRVLETAARATGRLAAWSGNTDIFITPGFRFNVVDRLVTNFHLPKSTLLMLVSAFLGGVDAMQALYRAAIGGRYRFYSYGDACLLTRESSPAILNAVKNPVA